MKAKAYLFFGLPGAGKGTQRELLEAYLVKKGATFLSLEMGQLLREYVVEDSNPEKKKLEKVMASGGLVPSAFPATMWVNKLMSQEEPHDVFLFDGAGRKPAEAQVLVELLTFFRQEVHVILIDISEEESIKRLMERGRADDTEEALRTRFSLFNSAEKGTVASLTFLRAHPDVTFHTVDGIGSIEEVHERLVSEVGYDNH